MLQNRATDQWAYYQAKNIRLHNYEMSIDVLALIEFQGQGAGRESPREVSEESRNDIRRNRAKSRSRPRISRMSPQARSERRTASIWGKCFWKSPW